jgi:protein phosphatase
MDRSGLWETLHTDWALLDCELMPWSAKTQELLRQQYAAVGAAATAALPEAVSLLRQASERTNGDSGLQTLVDKYAARETMAEQFVAAYRRYCWPVHALSDLKIAPFHLLATEGTVHTEKDHRWHLETLGRLCAADDTGLLFTTRRKEIAVTDAESVSEGVRWWEELTAGGGEGMVVKPLDFIARGERGIVQPAVKCRGREYLRIIYGPEYTAPENLERLRSRGLAGKRSLALREFALGVEGLERFVRHEPLRRVHECVFGVLALESEPVDPRL